MLNAYQLFLLMSKTFIMGGEICIDIVPYGVTVFLHFSNKKKSLNR